MDAVIKVKLDERARSDRKAWIGFITNNYPEYIGYWASTLKVAGGWHVRIPDDLADKSTGLMFQITRAFAARAFDLMVGLYGMHWYGKADASKYDEAIQLAAFGKRVFA